MFKQVDTGTEHGSYFTDPKSHVKPEVIENPKKSDNQKLGDRPTFWIVGLFNDQCFLTYTSQPNKIDKKKFKRSVNLHLYKHIYQIPDFIL